MIKKLKLFFFNLYLTYITKVSKTKVENLLAKELNGSLGSTDFSVNYEQNKIAEAIRSIKNKINRKVETSGDYHSTLTSVEDLGVLASGSEKSGLIKKMLYQAHIKDGADVKSEKDKEDMINKRIEAYNELQRFNLEKELLRKIRKAEKSGDLQLAQKLAKEWKEVYGKSTNPN